MTREEAIDIIRKNIPHLGIGATEMTEALNELIPELRESEDEKIRQGLLKIFKQSPNGYWAGMEIKDIVAYLEKQKEQKQTDLPAGFYYIDLNGNRYYSKEFRYGDMKLKVGEQKPISTEDMPYVADEHFFEREPADSFKYRLAEYMTKNCKKGEGPYGYSYNISSESILQMAKEELLKRGELKDPKPAWSEEDEKMLKCCLIAINHYEKTCNIGDHLPTKFNIDGYLASVDKVKSWLKSLRPGWKPTEEQMDALAYAIQILDNGLSPKAAKAGEELESLREQLKKL